MNKTIGTWKLGNAHMEISSLGLQYQIKLSLPDATVVVSHVTQEELLALGCLPQALRQGGEVPLERWDGQSGG